MIYRRLVRPLLFQLDPERSHDLSLSALGFTHPIVVGLLPPTAFDRRLEVTVAGVRFPAPVGLAAGFDKAARALWAWPALGFGFVEIGTVTARAQPGNPKPRVFRLPRDQALINRLGFNSPGADAMAERLAAFRRGRPYPIPLAVNIGRSRAASNEEAVDDYVYSFDRLQPHADFVVVNVSSPNTPGLRQLQMRDAIVPLLDALTARNRALGEKPLFVKIAPDLSDAELDEVVAAAGGRAHGIVATNTTLRRDGLVSSGREEAGGLSGRPLRAQALRVIGRLRRLTGARLAIIGVGGIFTAEDAYAMIKAGASLVELYTGFVYGGPTVPRTIARGLLSLLDRDGLKNIAAAAGVEAPAG
ncbi:MAG TPA: quinone-dependent dihydroorotate dehydrogenase [bacterium]|nr:quinone-dependent dihydroorotate dehydrogenase [bacterium]